MTRNTITFQKQAQPWFKNWFDTTYYHRLYANRNDQEAADFINNLVKQLQPVQGSSMLDVGCGAGRHCRQLASKGYKTTGIDLALSSIKEALCLKTGSQHFFQHDMRLPFGHHHYDYVFNFFTSFGYFTTRQENLSVVHNMSNALKPGGTLVLDYINACSAEQRLVPVEYKEIDGAVYHLNRWVTDTHFFKRIEISDKRCGESFEYIEQVAKFSLDEFTKMFGHAGLQVQAVYGDYTLGDFSKLSSPRLIMVGKKVS